jgi:protein O-mannosyl-transferase
MEEPRSRGSHRRRVVAAAFLLAALAPLAVYLPTPGDSWIRYDDELLIRREPKIRLLAREDVSTPAAVVEIFSTPHGDLYQPLATLSLAIDYALFGWDRTGWHAHSLLLHELITAGVFLLAYRLCGTVWAALLASLFIGVHPMTAEVVSWPMSRVFLATAVWILLGTHAYLSYARDPRRWGWLAASTAAYGVAFTGKAIGSVVVLPFLLDAWVRRRPSARLVVEKLPLLALAIFFTWLNLYVSASIARAQGVELPGLAHAALDKAPGGLLLSIANLVAPHDLALFYANSAVWDFLGMRWIAAVAAVLGALALGILLWRRGQRGLLLGMVGWLALVAPFLAATSFRAVATADRYVYIASLVLMPGIAEALTALRPQSRAWRRIAGAALLLLLLGLGLQGRAHARQWLDEVKVWQAVVAKGPHPIAYGAMANVYSERGQWHEAVEACLRSVELAEGAFADASAPIFHDNLAETALQAAAHAQDQAERARYLDVALRGALSGIQQWPNDAALEEVLGRVYLARGDPQHAREAFERAVARDPGNIRSLATLGAMFEGESEYGAAAEQYFHWLIAAPGARRAHERFMAAAVAGSQAGQSRQVRPWLERYLERFPTADAARQLLQESEVP